MTPDPVRLDPVTLRALAVELDEEADALTNACARRPACRQCRPVRDRCLARAADYRTRAIQADQAARAGA